MKRVRKQYTCRCGAYEFPHRFGGGRCDGYAVAVETRSRYWMCGDCHLNNNGCEVLTGQEHPRECPGVQELLNEWEIKL